MSIRHKFRALVGEPPFMVEVAERLWPLLAAEGVKKSALPAYVAQIAAETADGTSRNVRKRNNYAGIRGGRITVFNTRGYRIYPTPEAGIHAYVALVKRRYPLFLRAGRLGKPELVIHTMGLSLWAATHYRLGADGTNDKAKPGTLGRPGTEGQALKPWLEKAQQLGIGQDLAQGSIQ